MACKRSASARYRRLAVALPFLLVFGFHGVTFNIPKRMHEVAQDKGISDMEYLQGVSAAAESYKKSDQIAGRTGFIKALQKAMQKPGLYLVIGGKSLGKTKIMQKMDQVVAAYSPLLYVNMRHPPQPESTDALECLQAKAKDLWSAKYVPPWAGTVAGVMISLARVVGKESLKKGDAEGGVELAFSELLNVPKPQEFLWAFVDAAVSMKQIPTMIIDEANIAFPNTNGNGDSKSKREAASRALATFVAMTKESCKACVILPASDFAFPWGLQTLGFNKFDALQTIVIPEVEREPMLALLTEWGLPRDVAEEFYMIFGGNILLCQQAIDKLLEQFERGAEDSFDPFSVRGTDGLAGLAKDPLTREHLENLARQGWSPIEEGSADGETESQKGARIIAKKSFGGVINRETTTFLDQDLRDDMFSNRSTKQVLIPATIYLRNCIKVELQACEPSSAASQPSAAVWVCQLGSPDGEEFIGNAFQVKGVLANVDDLKEAIEKKEKLTIAASKINIHHQEDGRWVKDDEDSAVDRGKSKADCYRFTLPAGAAGAT
ncbi:unnamed protein product [Effrenium voratum]|uniref:Uncharacterized protein n=1 Tax=Effrenium voratum TaxID=2562239 RepID=A0AA36IPA1_9DINO|nr:unnamed protein product [Effrenium voratum]